MRQISIVIAMSVGILTLADYFFTHPILHVIGEAFREWAIILTAFALLLGIFNLLNVHFLRVLRREEPGVGYSVVVLVSATIVTILGLFDGPPSDSMTWIFENLYFPLQSAFFALAAFFLATAAYRALRARNLESMLMLVAALVVFIGQTPLLNWGSEFKDWVLRVPAEAGIRGILIGVALGTIATGMRLLFGLDRPYSE